MFSVVGVTSAHYCTSTDDILHASWHQPLSPQVARPLTESHEFGTQSIPLMYTRQRMCKFMRAIELLGLHPVLSACRYLFVAVRCISGPKRMDGPGGAVRRSSGTQSLTASRSVPPSSALSGCWSPKDAQGQCAYRGLPQPLTERGSERPSGPLGPEIAPRRAWAGNFNSNNRIAIQYPCPA